VLLLEAGPDLRAEMPADFRDGWAFPRRQEWGYESEPDARGQSVPLRRGKLVGGTSWVTRFGVRGSPLDFAAWERLGCSGWGFDDVLPWFRRLERDVEFGDRPWHGDNGPMPVTRYPAMPHSEFAAAAMDGCSVLGINVIEDHNEPGAVGIARMPMTAQRGQRVTTADAYLPLAPDVDLTVRAGALVANVVVERERAVGVRLVDGTTLEGGRVVICGGVYGSPALLMRSGLGPADHLRDRCIDVVADLPGVGANLADHPQVWMDSGCRGADTDAPQLHTLATFRSSRCSADEPPDLAFWLADPQPGGEPDAAIEILLMTPASRGVVRLHSRNPEEAPLIRLPCLDAPGDLERLLEGLQRAQDLARTSALRRICADPLSPRLSTDDDGRDWIAKERYSIPHTVGTCAMGGAPADGAVVDPAGSVYGVDGLTVVDASVIPTAPSGFPHLVTIMLAERLSDIMARL
jgi:choline dehydrogenase